ncbi:DUF1697 domain-containing protein [uncultured Porphyromonas sp.]|uniref:DUF1697 domain-containing protein n=1 Tax=uncultured Porphyromonas sp. TaxID=159274 RepID=UPI0026114014|nr:DUF1697 domain-containing protein [uncultured Porphyromonas sp.]
MKQEQIILLRGVMPSGKNSIPKMAILRQHLEDAGFEAVRTYIQSGNILLRSDLPKQALSERIHDLISEKYGADLAALVFLPEELQAWVDALPFSPELDPSRVFFTMTMEHPKAERRQALSEKPWGEATLHLTEQCAYIHAPKTYKNSKLTNNALERHLGVTCTTRNLNTLRRILALASQED